MRSSARGAPCTVSEGRRHPAPFPVSEGRRLPLCSCDTWGRKCHFASGAWVASVRSVASVRTLRPWPPWTWCTRSRTRNAHSAASAVGGFPSFRSAWGAFGRSSCGYPLPLWRLCGCPLLCCRYHPASLLLKAYLAAPPSTAAAVVSQICEICEIPPGFGAAWGAIWP